MADNGTFFAIFDTIIKEVDVAPSLNKKQRVLLTESLKKSAVRICEKYATVRDSAKTNYMKRGLDARLDRHKCAAAFVIAFLERLDIKDAALSKTLVREYLAIQAGLIVLGAFIGEDNDKSLAKFLDKNNGFALPQIIHKTRQEYLYIWAMELRYLKNENKLSVLSLAHELFYLESYNKLCVKSKDSATPPKKQTKTVYK